VAAHHGLRRRQGPGHAQAGRRYTYFLPDVAYHLNKWRRGFERVINEQGADHHSTVTRVRAGLQALDEGIPEGWPDYVLHQMVTVMRDGQEVKLSKRAGSYLTLRDLIDEVGRDATRYFLVARSPNSQLTFDIDLALSQSNDNPVYYIQYAHARVCSVQAQTRRGRARHCRPGIDDLPLARLEREQEAELLKQLARFPEVVARAATARNPSRSPTTCASSPASFTPTTTPTRCWSTTRSCAPRAWPVRGRAPGHRQRPRPARRVGARRRCSRRWRSNAGTAAAAPAAGPVASTRHRPAATACAPTARAFVSGLFLAFHRLPGDPAAGRGWRMVEQAQPAPARQRGPRRSTSSTPCCRNRRSPWRSTRRTCPATAQRE
jgi:hypothetical protein